MPDICTDPYDFRIGVDEQKDYNISFAQYLQDQGGITITNYTVVTSPEMVSTGDQIKNFDQDVVVVLTGIKENSRGWCQVIAETNKSLPNARVHTKEVTVVFDIVEQVTGQNAT